MTVSQNRTEQLWSRFAAGVRRFLRTRLPSDALADDLLQETFLRVHRRSKTLRDDQSARGWVYQIARNLLIDYYRGEGRRDVEPLDGPAVADEGSDLSADELTRQIAGWLQNTMATLPDTYREATRLSAVEGLTQQQIAARLGISREAAKSRIRRGREQLKASLDACCSFEVDGRGDVLDYQARGSGSCCSGGGEAAC